MVMPMTCAAGMCRGSRSQRAWQEPALCLSCSKLAQTRAAMQEAAPATRHRSPPGCSPWQLRLPSSPGPPACPASPPRGPPCPTTTSCGSTWAARSLDERWGGRRYAVLTSSNPSARLNTFLRGQLRYQAYKEARSMRWWAPLGLNVAASAPFLPAHGLQMWKPSCRKTFT